MSSRRGLSIVSILDAKVITGPARGLIHLARHLPPNAHLHVALLRSSRDTSALPPIERVARCSQLSVHTLPERTSYDPRVILRARDLAREVAADVIQSHSYKPHAIALGVRALYGAPWLAFHHGWTAENFKIELFHAIDRITLRFADRVIPVSHSAERLVLEAGCSPKRTSMITNAVDPADLQSDWTPAAARSAFGLAPNAVVVAAIGRLSREKGQDVLIEAFARAAGELPELALAIAGDGPDDTKLRERARALGLGERVKFLGHQPHVARVYAASDIVVLPSRSEGMPNALLEAMCLGRAVVSTNVGGVSEVATDGDTAWIVPSENPDALAMALLHAARDPRERARRAENARAHVRATMSPASRAARFVALYEGILGRKFSARNRDFESRSDSIGRPMDFEPTVRA